MFEEYRRLELGHADALVLFAGRGGLAERQAGELNVALARSEHDNGFAIVGCSPCRECPSPPKPADRSALH
jgi:hypothetical protein